MRDIQSPSYGAFTTTIVDEWLDVFQADVLSNKLAIQRLLVVLDRFKDFAQKYEIAVLDLAVAEEQANNLTRQNLKVAIKDQIEKALDIYWAPLSQISSQYVSEPYRKELLKNPELEQRIDQYLQNINDLVGKAGLVLPGILVFFDELTLIHYYPYSDVALVSLPYRVFKTNAAIEMRSSSIAHELGHYLYWHMADFTHLDDQQQKLMDDLNQQFVDVRSKEEWLFVGPWVEEIFADVVGAWIAGKSFLDSGNERIMAKAGLDPDSLNENDHRHVPDILRPFVASYTLQKKGALVNGAAEWNAFLGAASMNNQGLSITAEIVEDGFWSNFLTRYVEKTPDELIPAIQFVVDYLIESIEKFKMGQESPFNFVFSTTKNMDELKARAQKIALAQKKQEMKAYEILMQPMVIEAEQSGKKHQHSYYTYYPHFHKDKPKSHRHT